MCLHRGRHVVAQTPAERDLRLQRFPFQRAKHLSSRARKAVVQHADLQPRFPLLSAAAGAEAHQVYRSRAAPCFVGVDEQVKVVHLAAVVVAREQRQHRVVVPGRRARRCEREHRQQLLLLGGVGVVGGGGRGRRVGVGVHEGEFGSEPVRRVAADLFHHDEGVPHGRCAAARGGEADGADGGRFGKDAARRRACQAARQGGCAQQRLHGAGPVRAGARPVLHPVRQHAARLRWRRRPAGAGRGEGRRRRVGGCGVRRGHRAGRGAGGGEAVRGGLVLCAAGEELPLCFQLLCPQGFGVDRGVCSLGAQLSYAGSAGRPVCPRSVESVEAAPVRAVLAEPVEVVELVVFAVQRAAGFAAVVPFGERAATAALGRQRGGMLGSMRAAVVHADLQPCVPSVDRFASVVAVGHVLCPAAPARRVEVDEQVQVVHAVFDVGTREERQHYVAVVVARALGGE